MLTHTWHLRKQYKTRKNKNVVFFVFLWLFFFQSQQVEISIIGMFRRSFRVPRGPERSTNRLWWVYMVNTKCQHAQYTSHWILMAPLLRHISEFDSFPLICVDLRWFWKMKNAKSACSGHRPDRTATRPMVKQYQMLFFMDRTKVVYDSVWARTDFAFSKLTVLRCNLPQNPIVLSSSSPSGGLKGAAMSKTCFTKNKCLETYWNYLF